MELREHLKTLTKQNVPLQISKLEILLGQEGANILNEFSFSRDFKLIDLTPITYVDIRNNATLSLTDSFKAQFPHKLQLNFEIPMRKQKEELSLLETIKANDKLKELIQADYSSKIASILIKVYHFILQENISAELIINGEEIVYKQQKNYSRL